jgi:hypothetical protein
MRGAQFALRTLHFPMNDALLFYVNICVGIAQQQS